LPLSSTSNYQSLNIPFTISDGIHALSSSSSSEEGKQAMILIYSLDSKGLPLTWDISIMSVFSPGWGASTSNNGSAILDKAAYQFPFSGDANWMLVSSNAGVWSKSEAPVPVPAPLLLLGSGLLGLAGFRKKIKK
jgi:hypothetical protein